MGKDQGVKYYGMHTFKYTKWQSKYFETEKQAALAYDKGLIEIGLQPVHVLKPKV